MHRIYNAMLTRCYNKNEKDKYERYGGRGITIDDIWLGENGFLCFYKWSMANGYNDSLSIDRIDNNKGYSPENCRWATSTEQSENKRCNRFFEYKGNMFTLSQVSRSENVKYGLLYSRVALKNMSVEEAIKDIKASA